MEDITFSGTPFRHGVRPTNDTVIRGICFLPAILGPSLTPAQTPARIIESANRFLRWLAAA